MKREEIIGIILMIIAIFLLGLSELSIDITNLNLLEAGFITRTVVLTILFYLGSGICEILQKKNERFKGILLAISSGFQFAITNFWISFIFAFFAHVFGGNASIGELILFIITAVILILSTIIGIVKIQQSFKVANANRMIPIQQVPIQITPVLVYFIIFMLIAPSAFSIFYMLIGVILILISSFLLAKRQAQLEEIK